MKIYASRDSVSAGDDVEAPHSSEFSLRTGISLKEALAEIQSKYLPKISGGIASWSVASNIPVAVLAQQWKEPRMLLLLPEEIKELDSKNGVLRLHFNYHAQLEPEHVLEVLRHVRLNAI
jgi:hypothetical protein